jgi:hypothetical protein
LAWRDLAESLLANATEVRPADALVIPARCGGWLSFGHIPDVLDDPVSADCVDLAEAAFHQSHGRVLLRLAPPRLAACPPSQVTRRLTTWISDVTQDDTRMDLSLAALRSDLRQLADSLPADASEAVSLRLLADAR